MLAHFWTHWAPRCEQPRHTTRPLGSGSPLAANTQPSDAGRDIHMSHTFPTVSINRYQCAEGPDCVGDVAGLGTNSGASTLGTKSNLLRASGLLGLLGLSESTGGVCRSHLHRSEAAGKSACRVETMPGAA